MGCGGLRLLLYCHDMQVCLSLTWHNKILIILFFRYRDGDLTTTGLLKHISTFYKPTVIRDDI